jgi:hypothetical protein
MDDRRVSSSRSRCFDDRRPQERWWLRGDECTNDGETRLLPIHAFFMSDGKTRLPVVRIHASAPALMYVHIINSHSHDACTPSTLRSAENPAAGYALYDVSSALGGLMSR